MEPHEVWNMLLHEKVRYIDTFPFFVVYNIDLLGVSPLAIDSWGLSDLYTPTNVDYLLSTLTPLIHSQRYLGLCLNF